jgi:TRAP-type mannitol/chloroaromatic compound transport system permease large subunit
MQQILLFGVLMAAFMAFAVIGVPVFFAMGLAALVFIAFSGGAVPVNIVASSMVQGMDSFAFLAIPFFFLAGELMNTGGITRRLLNFASAAVGHIRGGLSHVAILASMVFSGVSGSAVADASAIGSSMIPAMKDKGYPGAYAAAVVAAASTMGPIIPPSIAFVVYALVSDVSVGQLFLAGAIPGLLMGVYLLAAASWVAHRRQLPYSERTSLRAVGRTRCPRWPCRSSSSAASWVAWSRPPRPASSPCSTPSSSACCSTASSPGARPGTSCASAWSAPASSCSPSRPRASSPGWWPTWPSAKPWPPRSRP